MSSFLFSNFEEHPTDQRYLVFRFLNNSMANDFAHTLDKNQIPFERFEENGEQTQYFFAVKKNYQDEAKKINYLIYARHRKPLIPNKIGRFLLVGTVIALIILGLIGYLKANG